MDIQIVEILSNAPIRVRFKSNYGACQGIWMTGTPHFGRRYDVELDIPETLHWGKTILGCDAEASSIDMVGNNRCIIGTLHTIDDDLVVSIHLGKSLILLETAGTPPPSVSYVKVITHQIFLYDTGLY